MSAWCGLTEQQALLQARDLIFGQQVTQDQLAASDRSQLFDEQLVTQSSEADLRARQLQEDLLLRQLPLNELMALISGNQTALPQFQPFTGSDVEAAPILQGGIAQSNAQQALFETESANANAQLAAITDTASFI